MSEMKTERGKKMRQVILSGNGEWCNQHTLSRGSDWAVGKPVNSLGSIVIKLGPDIDLVYELGHRVTSSTSVSLVEPYGQITRF